MAPGEVTERLKVRDWKSRGRVKPPRGFESHPLRSTCLLRFRATASALRAGEQPLEQTTSGGGTSGLFECADSSQDAEHVHATPGLDDPSGLEAIDRDARDRDSVPGRRGPPEL